MADAVRPHRIRSGARGPDHETSGGVGEKHGRLPAVLLKDHHGTFQGEARFPVQELAPHHLPRKLAREGEEDEKREEPGAHGMLQTPGPGISLQRPERPSLSLIRGIGRFLSRVI